MVKNLNLIYFKDASINGNFGDELSKFITEKLINKNNYNLVFNQNNIDLNILCIGSYIHCAKENTFILVQVLEHLAILKEDINIII